MDDKRIIDLYFKRSEEALAETERKYGPYLFKIANGILGDREDAQECVNDTYSSAWDAIPPHRPAILSTFLGKITRRIAIDRLRRQTAVKRGGGALPLALEELEDCVSSKGDVEEELLRRELVECFNRFLDTLPATERRVFLRRYWYLDPIGDIAKQFGFTESKVTAMLHRTRKKLKFVLEKEGY